VGEFIHLPYPGGAAQKHYLKCKNLEASPWYWHEVFMFLQKEVKFVT
jgi:hypothetical protein